VCADYVYEFDPDAANNTAAAIYRLAGDGGERVLDLGSGPGIVAAALQRDAGKQVTCLDVSELSLARAREAGVARTVHADLGDPSWPDAIGDGAYDVIILADVLEHLYDPGAVLDVLHDRRLLADDGFIVISIPNASHEAVIGSLVAGDFTYTETGLLDATHIRFFTKTTFLQMCEAHGYTVSRLHRTLRTLEQTEKFGLTPDVAEPLRRALAESSADHRTYQYVARVVPLGEAGRLRVLADRIAELQEQRVEAVKDLRKEKSAVDEALVAHQAQLARERNTIVDQRAALEGLRAQRDEAMRTEQARAAALEAEHRAVEQRLMAERAQLEAGHHTAEQRWIAERARLEKEFADVRQRLDASQEVAEGWREQAGAARSQADALRREVDAVRAQANKLRNERDTVSSKEREARRKVEEIYVSETWKVGHALLWAPKRLRALVRRDGGGGTPQSLAPADSRSAVDAPSGIAVGSHSARLALVEDRIARQRYEVALARRSFSDDSARRVVMGVSTTDLDQGRGDLYTAIGLGRHLEKSGYQVVYLGKEDWHDVPEGTQVFLSMLAERTAMLDPLTLPGGITRIAWARNLTQRWASSGTLPFYDGVLCSSLTTLRALRRFYGGPLALLRVGVDEELFDTGDVRSRSAVVSTVNSWGQERQVHTALCAIDKDFPLALYGQQRGTPDDLRAWTRSPVSFFSLPSLYGQAAVVLDDQQDVNRWYGNINSRVYESLASGALPISNSAVGLVDVGLSDLPVYDQPEDLHRIVTHYLREPVARARLVAELREVVLREHTYSARAEEFHRFLVERVGQVQRTDRTIIGFTPDYRATNPYQDMLYAKARQHDAVAIPMPDPVRVAESPALDGRQLVYHIHWTATILGPATNERDAEDRRRRFVADLDAIKAAGVKLIWTVHNAMPHECAYPKVERRLASQIAERANAIHVMCAETPQLVAGDYLLPEKVVRVIPHGSYIDVHPNLIDGDEARRELGLSPDHTVLLFLGGIRPYKGVAKLLDAFEPVNRARPDYRLVVAGMPGRFQGVERLRQRCEAHPAILPRFAAVPDDDLQVYLNAADVVVLPHRRVLNSGGLMMAWSFARPVIASRTGCVAGQVHDRLGLTFDPQDDADLANALLRADELKSDEIRRACYAEAARYRYTAMSDDYFALLEELFDPNAL
jgi:glycosyltransferase involved in cell wall biosynthesis/2-polyprenyl-3-methyl-5-hydroxy-6-metoxy-1,4-benzoquinol methylase